MSPIVRPSDAADGRPVSGVVPRSAALVAPDDELRLLLRGLLHLYRHQVVREATRLSEVAAGSGPAPAVLLFAVADGDPRWSEELAATLRVQPQLRAIVLLPPGAPDRRGPAIDAGADAVLVRPFALKEFVAALSSLNEARVEEASAQTEVAYPSLTPGASGSA